MSANATQLDFSAPKPSWLLSTTILLSFLLPYVRGFLIFPIYAVLLFFALPRLRLQHFDILFGLLLLIFFFWKLIALNFFDCFQLFRVFFGYYFFYLFFKSFESLTFINFNKAVLLVAVAVLVEAILINTIVDPAQLAVFPNFETSTARTALYGFYQRPYSIGSNASVTSVLITVMLSLAYIQRQHFYRSRFAESLGILAIVALISGAGFCISALYFLSKLKLRSFLPALGILLFSVFFISSDLQPVFLTKLSSSYMTFLMAFKEAQIGDVVATLHKSSDLMYQFLFGSFKGGAGGYGGDFGWLDFFTSMGFTGLGLFIVFFASKLNSVNFIPLSLFFLASFHYSAMMSGVGQILMGFCFALTPKTNAVAKQSPIVEEIYGS